MIKKGEIGVASKKLRRSFHREIIYDIISSTDIHPTAEWIYERAKKVIPTISLGTVYRNLNILKEEGRIIEIVDEKEGRFDAKTYKHFHFKCHSCGNIYDVENLDIINIDKNYFEKRGFSIEGCDIVFNGICNYCLREGN
jgi:Fur family ferric uptake transcriptional regulator/Fur family peroxide stress response transcriptional regulator